MKLPPYLVELWAKWNVESPVRMHSVVCHLLDVMHVADELWRTALGDGLRAGLAAGIGLPVEDARRWIAFWVGAHDLGKVSPVFQRKVPDAMPGLRAVGFDFSENISDRIPHGEVSAIELRRWLNLDHAMPLQLARQVAQAVGGHHGRFIPAGRATKLGKLIDSGFDDELDDIGGGQWADARKDVLRVLGSMANLPNVGQWGGLETQPSTNWLLTLAGLTTVADWMGSMTEFFEMAGPIEDLSEYIPLSRQRAERVVREVGWSGWQAPAVARSPEMLFPIVRKYGMRSLQVAVEEIKPVLCGPSLVLIEAPMGEGKTEAAMSLAEHWSVTLQQRGCYFALATMATSNQMFGRLREFLEQRFDDTGDRVNLLLLHGRASLSDALQELIAAAKQPQGISDDSGQARGDVVASEWFTYRKRGLLAPFGVGTVDQLLMAVLPVKHVFVRLFGLAQKTVIIDEVHAYDAYMSVLLEHLLRWLRSLGTSVVLLSATLPKSRRETLLAAYRGGNDDDGSRTRESSDRSLTTSATTTDASTYPRLSWLDEWGEIQTRGFKASRQIALWIEFQPHDVAEWGSALRAALERGGCAAVICNTVSRAQDVYRELQPLFADGELDLFHARFPFVEREERERRALAQFGRPKDLDSSLRPRRVLVATQVIEQSLDIDFDLMVTELAPIDLVLQRAGRLQRHERIGDAVRDRPIGFETPTLWLLTPQWRDDGLPDWGPSGWVYEPHILLRSWLTISQQSAGSRSRETSVRTLTSSATTTISFPDDIEPLIEAVYDEDRLCPNDLPPAWQTAWATTLEKLRQERDAAETEAESKLIKPPQNHHEGSLSATCSGELDEDSPELHRAFQALTRRETRPSVSIVCLFASSAGPRLAAGGAVVDLKQEPDHRLTEALIRRSVSISHGGIVSDLLADEDRVPKAWRKNSLLRSQRLVEFNAAGECVIGDFRLKLDPDLGLCFLSSQADEDL